MGETANELAAAQDQMLLLGRKTAKERMASFLVGLSRRASKRRQPASPLSVPMTRTETICRTLTHLRHAKLIDATSRDRIEILDLEGLLNLIDGASQEG